MIPQADLERAIARWKARNNGAVTQEGDAASAVAYADDADVVADAPGPGESSGLIALDDAELQTE